MNDYYYGVLLGSVPEVRKICGRGLVEEIDPRRDLVEYSAAFDWGNKGAAAHQLAIAILAEVLGDELALDFYEDFAAQVVAKLPASWILEAEDVNGWFLGLTWSPSDELLTDLSTMEGGAP